MRSVGSKGQVVGALRLGACLLAAALCQEASPIDFPSVTDLAAAFEGRSGVEPRFSGGFEGGSCLPEEVKGWRIPHARCSPQKGEGSSAAGATAAMERLRRRFESAPPDSKASRLLHAKAVFAALNSSFLPEGPGREKALDGAIAALDRLCRVYLNRPLLLNDLGAAWMLKALSSDEPADLVDALDWIEQAHARAPHRSEILFNRALLLDRLRLTFLARDAWKAVASELPGTSWAEVASRRLALLNQPGVPERWKAALPDLELAAARGDRDRVRQIVEIDRQRAREAAMEDELGGWGDRYLAGDRAGAERDLKLARAIGEALFEARGDASVHEAVAAIDATPSPARLAALARGHRAFRDGRQAFVRWQNGAIAERFFVRAEADLRQGSAISALWATEWRARAIGYQSRYEESLRIHQTALRALPGPSYPALAGIIRWGVSWTRYRMSGGASALPEDLEGYQRFAAAGEAENTGAMEGMVGDSLYRLGQGRTAARYWYAALGGLSGFPTSLRRHNTLLRFQDWAEDRSLHHAAVALRAEQLAASGGDPVQEAEALWGLGELHAQSGRSVQGLAELRESRRRAATISKDGSGSMLEAEIDAALGKALRPLVPARALEPLNRAIDFFARDGGVVPEEAASRIERANAHLSLGGLSEARRDVEISLSKLEARLREVGTLDQRSTSAESLQDTYDAALQVEWAASADPARLLALLESAHGARDGVSVVPALRPLQPGYLDDLASRLPPEIFVVAYTSLPDRLLTWTFHAGKCRVSVRPIERRDLELQIDTFVDGVLGKPSARFARAGESLAAWLLPDALWDESRSGPVVFVPDRLLHRIPFAALRGPGGARHLIEARPVLIAPAIAPLLGDRSGNGNESECSSKGSALLVGNPTFDRRLFPELRDLPGAAAEIREAETAFPQNQILVGSAATRPAFLTALPSAETVLFAGHSGVNPEHPGSSYLILSPEGGRADGGGESLVLAQEIAALRLPRLRDVILSSCLSVGSSDSRSGGFLGIARAFLDAGARSVVGTLWSVYDDAQAELISDLLRHLATGLSLEESLRQAQLRALRSKVPSRAAPAAWSGVEIVVRRLPCGTEGR